MLKLETTALNKKYSDTKWGIKDLSIVLTNGVTGLVGPNGAGKSTLMRMLATIQKPTSGNIFFCGANIATGIKGYRDRLGYLPQDFSAYPHLNVVEFLHYIAAAKGIARRVAVTKIEELLHLLNLETHRSKLLSAFSGGMLQRAGIAQALLNDPQVLIMDEPTAGLDPEERVRFRNYLSAISVDKIVILSTHIVSDIESIARSILVINNGEGVIHTTPVEFLSAIKDQVWELRIDAGDYERHSAEYLVTGTVLSGAEMQLRLIHHTPPEGAKPAIPNMEDAYIYFLNNAQTKLC